jgi:hypothetical protein
MATLGKMELTIKINEFPTDVKTVENGWKHFELDCDGQMARVTVKRLSLKKSKVSRTRRSLHSTIEEM